VYKNVDQFIKRAELMCHIAEVKPSDRTAGGPVLNHSMVTLISQATAPAHLAQMPESWVAAY
jgi:hypothetical protein